jgi:Flp pilus assembly protein TadG
MTGGAEVAAGRRRREVVAVASSAPRAADRPRRRGQRGAVTAEAAVVIPVLLALALGATWFVALAVTKVRVVDAAREVARVAARGDADTEAVAHGRRVAPAGTRFTVRRAAGEVVVDARVAVTGPGGLLAFLPAVTVESEAVAAEEPQ